MPNPTEQFTFTDLTSAGEATDPVMLEKGVFECLLADVDTSIVVRLEQAHVESLAAANLAKFAPFETAIGKTPTADGYFYLHYNGPAVAVRLKLLTITAGTPTLAVKLLRTN